MTPRPQSPSPSGQSPRRRLVAGIALIGALALVPQLTIAAPGDGADTTTTAPPADTTTSTTVPATTTTTTTTAPTSTTSTTVPATTTTQPPLLATTTTTTTTPRPTTTIPAPATTTTTVPPSVEPTAKNITVYPEQLGHILATIRYLESRGQYGISPNKGNASGAYQFIASTWQNYGGYPHAYLAPPHIQDERAAADVTMFLERWNDDVSMIPVLWYYPKAATNPALMDVVPVPSAGNVLTIREYQQRWLGVFSTLSGQPVPQPVSLADYVARLGIPPTPTLRDDDLPSLAYPVLGPSRIAAPDCSILDADPSDSSDRNDTNGSASRADIEAAGLCTDAAPSILFGVKLQPILAVADGVVTDVRNESGRPIGLTVTDVDGRSYIYSGFNDDNPGTSDGAAPDYLRFTELGRVGQHVWAGQVVGFMGDSEPLPLGVRADVPTDASVTIADDAVAPHLRLTIVDLDGTPIEAFGPVIDAVFSSSCRVAIGPWSVPALDGDPVASVTIETTDDDDEIDSEWIITSTGQVTASGWAAMINPSEGCTWAPTETYGPGAGGSNDVPGRWFFGLDLPTSVWLELALATDERELPLLRF